jgi:ketosteroid isomerase-like protein
MSREDVDALRAVYEEWEAGNLRAGQELLDANIESVWPQEFPSGGVYRGPHGHAKAMREWLGPWEEFTLTAEGFYAAGDRVVVPFRVRARGAGSGIAVERRWAHLWTMRGGKAIRFEVSLDPAEALRSVGVPDEPHRADVQPGDSIGAGEPA